MVDFSGISDISQAEDLYERQVNRWKGTVSRFKGKLTKMTKDVNGKIDDYYISPEIRQFFLHWSYKFYNFSMV